MLNEENMANRSSEFWGICCEGGKKYSQVVRQKFHMTMAALDPTVIPTSPVVSLMVDRGGCEYLLCSLKPSTLLQVNLNLYFDKGEKVTFSLIGKGKIHLSGYHIYDKNDSVPAAVNQKEAKTVSPASAKPFTPQKAKDKQKSSVIMAKESDDSSDVQEVSKEGKAVSPKKGKNIKKSKDNESGDDSEDDDSFDDLEDDDDDDDSSEDEESEEETEDNKKDSNRLKSYKRLWSSLTQSEEEEEEDDDSEDSDKGTSEKNGKEFQNKKRPKNEKSKVILNEKSVKNTPVKTAVNDVKSINKSPKQDLLNSSIGRTPMPPKKTLKEAMTNSSKAPTPKKVNFADVESSDSDNEDPSLNVSPSKAAQPSTPSSETKKKRKKKKKKNQATPEDGNAVSESPAQPKGLSSAAYNQKLPGGLEYEDIRVGNGPIAKKGRLVHVYYTGMLENNKVFDSREVGNKPFSFRLGSNQVIKGWDMAVEGMKVGGKRRMKIPPSLGYANARTGPIPPNSTLYFTVELKAVS